MAESLSILAAIHRLPRTRWTTRRDELVDRLDLGAFLVTPVRQLSLGERMRGELAAFAPQQVSAVTVLSRITTHLEVRDLAITEPDIEDVVRRLYQSSRRPT